MAAPAERDTPVVIEPDPPEVPSIWTVQTIIAYVSSLAIFVIGLLTLSGVTVPSAVGADIQLWAGAAVSVVGGLMSLGVYIYKVVLQKTAIAAGVPLHIALRL
jgi:hypothetical protein